MPDPFQSRFTSCELVISQKRFWEFIFAPWWTCCWVELTSSMFLYPSIRNIDLVVNASCGCRFASLPSDVSISHQNSLLEYKVKTPHVDLNLLFTWKYRIYCVFTAMIGIHPRVQSYCCPIWHTRTHNVRTYMYYISPTVVVGKYVDTETGSYLSAVFWCQQYFLLIFR